MLNIIKRKIHNLTSDQKFSEILSGSAWALSARAISILLGLVASIIIARVYGAEVVGIVAVMNSFLMLATIFTVLGTGTSLLRLIPEHLTKYSPTSAFKVYRKTQFIVILISLLTGTLFIFFADLIAARIFSKPHLSYYFALASAFVVFKSLMQLNTHAVRGLRLIKVFALMQVLPQGFNLLLLISLGFFWPTRDVPVYALLGSFAITGMMGWFIMEFAFRKKMQPGDPAHLMSAHGILTISLPMLMSATMAFFIGQTGVLIMGVFRTETEVGYYAIAVRLATLTTFVLNAINTMAAPKFSELFHSDNMDELFYVAQKSAKLIFWTTTPILTGLLIFGKPALKLLFGPDFTAAYGAMVILVIGQFINSISGSTGYFMNMTGNHKAFRNITLGAAIITAGLGFALIPSYGIIGAAFTGMVSLSFWNIGTLIFIKVKYGKIIGYLPFIRI